MKIALNWKYILKNKYAPCKSIYYIVWKKRVRSDLFSCESNWIKFINIHILRRPQKFGANLHQIFMALKKTWILFSFSWCYFSEFSEKVTLIAPQFYIPFLNGQGGIHKTLSCNLSAIETINHKKMLNGEF